MFECSCVPAYKAAHSRLYRKIDIELGKAKPDIMPSTTVRIYLLRHGETDWNVVRRLQGSVDIPLNNTGISQAAHWRSYFDDIPLAGIYSSSLDRALQTAALATGR